MRPALRPLPDALTLELRALTARRRQITEMLTAERNRLPQAHKPVQKRIVSHIRWLEAELERVDEELDKSIRQSPIWREQQAEIFGFYGISGKLSAAFGPLLFGLISLLSGSQRAAMLAVGLLFFVGLILLLRVEEPGGKGELTYGS